MRMLPAVLCVLVSGAALGGQPAVQPASSGRLILGEGSHWQVFYTAKTPMNRAQEGAELKEELNAAVGVTSWKMESPAPPDGWMAPDFQDGTWLRVKSLGEASGWHNYFSLGYTFSGPVEWIRYSPTLAMQCVRGKFLAPAGAQGLNLSVTYRGGLVIYLNGEEVARQHLPAGKLDVDSLAEEYPPDAFWRGPNQKVSADSRARRLEKALPAEKTRRGVNVLALEFHRAPFFGSGLIREDQNTRSTWATCGPASIELRTQAGAEPNVSRPGGIQVWNCPLTEWVDAASYGDPVESLCPIELYGVRNGAFCGQVVISSAQPVQGVKAEASELKQKGGAGAIPASAVNVFYVLPGEWLASNYIQRKVKPLLDTLSPTPPAEAKAEDGGAAQPVWVKVRVPADAPAGEYEGRLTVSAQGLSPTPVPVRLKVADWKLPDPRDYVTHLGLVESPESVAMWYKKELWSEEHWKLIEESLKLLGEVGNKTVYLPIIAKTNFGNEQGLVRFIKDGNGYKHDFTIFDRYLDLALKQLTPEVVCIYVWDAESMTNAGRGHKTTWEGVPVTAYDPGKKEASQIMAPKFDAPEAKAFWGPVFAEMREHLRKRGVEKTAMVGIIGEVNWGSTAPTKEVRASFEEFLPGAPWVTQTHPGDMGLTPSGYFTQVYITAYRTQLSWRPETYETQYLKGLKVAWRREAKQGWFCRGFSPASPLTSQHTMLERAFLHNLSGWGRVGADFWPVGITVDHASSGKHTTTYHRNTTTLSARYPETDWGQLNLARGGTEALLAPGPEGAVRTVRFEVVREGLQECEARIFIEKALVDPALKARLGDDLAKRCDALLTERVWALKSGGGDLVKLAEKLFAMAAEVAAKLK